MAAPNVTPGVNRVLLPRLAALGFSLAPPGDARWREGRFFSRRGAVGEQVIMVGRDKFGGALGVNVGRQLADGSYDYMLCHEQGLPRESLRYGDSEGLDDVLRRIIAFIETTAVPWLDAAS